MIGFLALTIAGCTPDISLKHRCKVDGDCAAGRQCTGGICAPVAAVDSSTVFDGGQRTETHRLGRDRANFMFVTSKPFELRFQPLEVADGRCNDAAAAAGLPGDYRAWLSTSEVHARDRLGQARGWVRPDGLPFADTVDDIAAGRIFMPPSINERGQDTAGSGTNETLVATGTNSFGYNAPGANCNDWRNDSGGIVNAGSPSGTTDVWTYTRAPYCDQPRGIYCFGVDQDFPVRPAPEPGKRVFVSEARFVSGEGIGAADSLCAAEAATAGLAGTFLALLPTGGRPAAARFPDAIAMTWLRIDGVHLNVPGTDIFSRPLVTTLNVTSTGRYVGPTTGGTGGNIVFTGGQTPLMWMLPVEGNCGDWSNPDRSASIEFGVVTDRLRWWWTADGRKIPCGAPARIYCLER